MAREVRWIYLLSALYESNCWAPGISYTSLIITLCMLARIGKCRGEGGGLGGVPRQCLISSWGCGRVMDGEGSMNVGGRKEE